VLGEHAVPPIFAHFRVDEILVNAGEFFAQYFVQNLDYFRAGFHGSPPII
jgi:hypothetical protein